MNNEWNDNLNGVNNNDTIKVGLAEERLNITKENVVTEELVIRKSKVHGTQHISEIVRREELDINETDTPQGY
ncbi:YsnF/AvaK domain-containing protein [Macrococcus equi]|uniref:YsnF/AvaK domain-containing protein n=1 Tax=Macrococcus equi TaxID=3395462 RepID=UPI0039BE4E4A